MGVLATTTSISELIPRFLSGNTTTSDTSGTNLFSRHIDRAEGIVMSYAGSRYDVSGFRVSTSTTDVPPILRTLAEDIACYYAIRGSYVQDGQLKQEYVDKYEAAMATLEAIRDGKTGLSYTGGATVAPRTSRFVSSTEEYAPVFNMDKPESWDVDPDQLDDIEDDRG